MKKIFPYALGILSAVCPAFRARAAAGSPVAAPGSPEFDLIGQSLTIVLALFLVIGILILTLWLFRGMLRMNRFPGIPQGPMSILEIRHIDPKRAVTLVRVLDRVLIVAWTDNGVALLGELTPDEASRLDTDATPRPAGFADILSRLMRKRTVPDASRKDTAV